MAWKALIADVGIKLGNDWKEPGDMLDHKLMTPEEIDAHITDGRAHYELRGRPDEDERPEKPEKSKKGKAD